MTKQDSAWDQEELVHALLHCHIYSSLTPPPKKELPSRCSRNLDCIAVHVLWGGGGGGGGPVTPRTSPLNPPPS